MDKNNKQDTALYRVFSDVYRKKHKIRARLFRGLLRHLFKTMNQENAIFYLMQEVQKTKIHTK